MGLGMDLAVPSSVRVPMPERIRIARIQADAGCPRGVVQTLVLFYLEGGRPPASGDVS